MPSKGYDTYPRICTWAIFDDGVHETPITIYNTHLPLIFNFLGKKKAIQVLLNRIGADTMKPLIVAGDFNACPKSPVWQALYAAGFLYGGDGRASVHTLTIPTVCIDGICTRGPLRVSSYAYVRTHHGLLYPSDHFGVSMVCERTSLHP